MHDLKAFLDTSSFLSSVAMPTMIISILLALIVFAFAPAAINKSARCYYHASIAAVMFRAWYSSTYTPGQVTWWGNLFWLNLLFASTVLIGAAVMAISRTHAVQREGQS